MSDLDTHKLIKYALEMKAKEKAGFKMINVEKIEAEIEKYSVASEDVVRNRKIEVIEKDVILGLLEEAEQSLAEKKGE